MSDLFLIICILTVPVIFCGYSFSFIYYDFVHTRGNTMDFFHGKFGKLLLCDIAMVELSLFLA